MRSYEKRILALQMQVDILKETITVLKKDPGADRTVLRSREKAAIIGALKNQYPLPKLLEALHYARSSYYYHIKGRKAARQICCVKRTNPVDF